MKCCRWHESCKSSAWTKERLEPEFVCEPSRLSLRYVVFCGVQGMNDQIYTFVSFVLIHRFLLRDATLSVVMPREVVCLSVFPSVCED